MPRLCEIIHPSLTDSITEVLFKKSIYTTLEYVETNPEFLVRITGLHYKQVLQIKDSILSKFASSVIRGNAHYDHILAQCALIPSGIAKLDDILDGGFLTGNIYEICGSSSSGKTQICMTVAVSISLTLQQNMLFIDTKNHVYAHRIVDIFDNHPKKTSDVATFLQRIKICQIASAYELLTMLHQTINEFDEQKSCVYKCIIIDSLTAVFYQFLGDQQSEGLNLLNTIANLLQYIAAEFQVAILITNMVTKWSGDCNTETDNEDLPQVSQPIQKAALGKYWNHIPDTRIHIRQLGKSNEALLTIVKSTSQPVGRTVKVIIADNGLS